MTVAVGTANHGSQRLTALGDPAGGTDATTQSWVLAQIDLKVSGQDWKASVRVATNNSVTNLISTAAIDGVTMVAGDRVLVKAQVTASQNGIYVWQDTVNPMVRATDADNSELLLK